MYERFIFDNCHLGPRETVDEYVDVWFEFDMQVWCID